MTEAKKAKGTLTIYDVASRAGVSIASPRLFRDMPADWPFSLNTVWDRAMGEGRLFGLPMRGTWMHVGDPQALAAAEKLIADEAAQPSINRS